MKQKNEHGLVLFEWIMPWQGWQSVVQTFDLDEDLDIEKIKALLNESDAEEEKK